MTGLTPEELAEADRRLAEGLARLKAVPESAVPIRQSEKYSFPTGSGDQGRPFPVGSGQRAGPAPEGAPPQPAQADALSNALAKLPTYGGTAWRSCALPADVVRGYAVGNVLVELAFVSATQDLRMRMRGNVTFVIGCRTARDVRALSPAPGDAEVVIDRGAFFLVLAVDQASEGDTVYLLELPRESSPADLSPRNARALRRLAQLRTDEANRRRVPEPEWRAVSTPDKYAFPVGIDTDGRPRLVVAGAG